MNKDLIFFYDINHGYSKDMISKIQKYSISNLFLIVDVSKGYKIPDFVDRVPLIYIRSSKEIVVDESIENLIENIIASKLNHEHNERQASPSQGSRNRQAQGNDQEQDNIDNILSARDHFKGLSDTFSFIDDEGQVVEDGDSMMSNRYLSLYENTENQITKGSEIEDGVKGPKFNEKQFDSFVSQRDSDLASLFPNQQGTRPPAGFFENR